MKNNGGGSTKRKTTGSFGNILAGFAKCLIYIWPKMLRSFPQELGVLRCNLKIQTTGTVISDAADNIHQVPKHCGTLSFLHFHAEKRRLI